MSHFFRRFPASKEILVVVGDFSVPQKFGQFYDDGKKLILVLLERPARHILRGCFYLCISQLNNVMNNNNRILDLVFCKCDEISIQHSTPLVNPIGKYHPAFENSLHLVYDASIRREEIKK